MAFIILEDLEGSSEFPVFPDLLDEKRSLLIEDNIILINGNVRIRDGQRRVSVDDLVLLDKLFSNRQWKATVRIEVPEAKLARLGIARLNNVILTHHGNHPLHLELLLENRQVHIACGKAFKINPDRQFIATIEEFFGEGCVHIQLHAPPKERRNGNGRYGKSNVVPLKGSS